MTMRIRKRRQNLPTVKKLIKKTKTRHKETSLDNNSETEVDPKSKQSDEQPYKDITTVVIVPDQLTKGKV